MVVPVSEVDVAVTEVNTEAETLFVTRDTIQFTPEQLACRSGSKLVHKYLRLIPGIQQLKIPRWLTFVQPNMSSEIVDLTTSVAPQT